MVRVDGGGASPPCTRSSTAQRWQPPVSPTAGGRRGIFATGGVDIAWYEQGPCKGPLRVPAAAGAGSAASGYVGAGVCVCQWHVCGVGPLLRADALCNAAGGPAAPVPGEGCVLRRSLWEGNTHICDGHSTRAPHIRAPATSIPQTNCKRVNFCACRLSRGPNFSRALWGQPGLDAPPATPGGRGVGLARSASGAGAVSVSVTVTVPVPVSCHYAQVKKYIVKYRESTRHNHSI